MLPTDYMYIVLGSLSPKDDFEAIESTGYLNLVLPVVKKGWNHSMEPGAHSAFVHPGLSIIEGRYKYVPNGVVKVFDRELLKKQGVTGEFVLFSALPYELRSEVFKHTLPSRQIHAGELVNPTGPGTEYQIIGAERPMICKVSKQAVEDLVNTGVYKPLFQQHHNDKKVYFSSSFDSLLVTTQFGPALAHGPYTPFAPRLALPAALRNMSDLMSIKSLNMDCMAFLAFLNWGGDIIRGMPLLDKVNLNMTILHPSFTQRTQEFFEFAYKPGQTRYQLTRRQGNSSMYGWAAVHSFCARLDPALAIYFSDIQFNLNHLLNLGQFAMPTLVNMVVWCSPVPAPLALASSGN